MADGGLGSDIGQVPELVERFTAAARRGASIPILAKLTPNVAAMGPAAEAAKRGGADGVAAINTIKSITGVDPHTYVSAPVVPGMSAVGGYSGSAVRPIALTSFSLKRTALPEWSAIMITALPSVSRASSSVSPSRTMMALMPFCLGRD